MIFTVGFVEGRDRPEMEFYRRVSQLGARRVFQIFPREKTAQFWIIKLLINERKTEFSSVWENFPIFPRLSA